MKFSVVVKLLLVFSIVLQSLTAAVSATSPSHQIDIEHLQTQHDHKSDSKESGNINNADEHENHDCHHCGHCTGSHFSWLFSSNFNNLNNLLNLDKTPYLFVHTKTYLNSIIRPPIS